MYFLFRKNNSDRVQLKFSFISLYFIITKQILYSYIILLKNTVDINTCLGCGTLKQTNDYQWSRIIHGHWKNQFNFTIIFTHQFKILLRYLKNTKQKFT